MRQVASRIIRAREEHTAKWQAAWQALDDIERIAKRTIAAGNHYAAAEIVDAVQRARVRMTAPAK